MLEVNWQLDIGSLALMELGLAEFFVWEELCVLASDQEQLPSTPGIHQQNLVLCNSFSRVSDVFKFFLLFQGGLKRPLPSSVSFSLVEELSCCCSSSPRRPPPFASPEIAADCRRPPRACWEWVLHRVTSYGMWYDGILLHWTGMYRCTEKHGFQSIEQVHIHADQPGKAPFCSSSHLTCSQFKHNTVAWHHDSWCARPPNCLLAI